jgi:hypothetical protein
MTAEKRSRKILVLATALTVVALAAVVAVYATAILGTFTGGPVTVQKLTATVTYSDDNSTTGTWSTTLQAIAGNDWYTRLEVNAGCTGSVTVTFQLQVQDSGIWTNTGTPITTQPITLTGSAQDIYSSVDGAISDNFDWGTIATSQGTYQIVATVNPAS